jgi:hypothetical protein
MITVRCRVDVAHHTGEHMQQVGAADDSDEIIAAHNRKPFNATLLHDLHDLFERCLLADRNRVGCHDVAHFAAVSARVFVGKPSGSDEKFEPARHQCAALSVAAISRSSSGMVSTSVSATSCSSGCITLLPRRNVVIDVETHTLDRTRLEPLSALNSGGVSVGASAAAPVIAFGPSDGRPFSFVTSGVTSGCRAAVTGGFVTGAMLESW